MQIDALLDVLEKGVDVAALRQSIHSSNIANADVEGYQRLEVQFAPEQMPSLPAKMADVRDAVIAATPEVVVPEHAGVQLDQEVAAMAQNSLRYQALLNAFERTLGLVRMAAREGKEG